jgi:hypothetical protein
VPRTCQRLIERRGLSNLIKAIAHQTALPATLGRAVDLVLSPEPGSQEQDSREILLDELRAGLGIKLYADGASHAQVLELDCNPLIVGFTTNPSLMRKAGIRDYKVPLWTCFQLSETAHFLSRCCQTISP